MAPFTGRGRSRAFAVAGAGSTTRSPAALTPGRTIDGRSPRLERTGQRGGARGARTPRHCVPPRAGGAGGACLGGALRRRGGSGRRAPRRRNRRARSAGDVASLGRGNLAPGDRGDASAEID